MFGRNSPAALGAADYSSLRATPKHPTLGYKYQRSRLRLGQPHLGYGALRSRQKRKSSVPLQRGHGPLWCGSANWLSAGGVGQVYAAQRVTRAGARVVSGVVGSTRTVRVTGIVLGCTGVDRIGRTLVGVRRLGRTVVGGIVLTGIGRLRRLVRLLIGGGSTTARSLAAVLTVRNLSTRLGLAEIT